MININNRFLQYALFLKLTLGFHEGFATEDSSTPPTQVIHFSTSSSTSSTEKDPYQWLEDPSWTILRPNVYSQDIRLAIDDENERRDKYFKPFKKVKKKISKLLEGLELREEDTPVKVKDLYFTSEESEETGYKTIYVSKEPYPKKKDKQLVLKLEELTPYPKDLFVEDKFIVSPDGRYLIYSFDLMGLGMNCLGFYDLQEKRHGEKLYLAGGLDEVIWPQDPSQGFYYTNFSCTTLNWHAYGQEQKADRTIYHDPEKFLGLSNTSDGQHTVLSASTHQTDEIYIVLSDKLLKLVDRGESLRVAGIDGYGNTIYAALINEKSQGILRRFVVQAGTIGETKDIIEPNSRFIFESLKTFDQGIVLVTKRPEGDSIYLLNHNGDQLKRFMIPQLLNKQIKLQGCQEFDSDLIGIYYSSLIDRERAAYLPMDASSQETKLIFPETIHPKYIPYDYQQKILYASAQDGTRIPITMAYKKTILSPRGDNILILSAYGAYGEREEFSVDESSIALMNAGVILAHAHVRGGGDYGPQWHAQGRLLQKKILLRTFLALLIFFLSAN